MTKQKGKSFIERIIFKQIYSSISILTDRRAGMTGINGSDYCKGNIKFPDEETFCSFVQHFSSARK